MFLILGIGLFWVIYGSLEHGMTNPRKVRYSCLEGRRSGNDGNRQRMQHFTCLAALLKKKPPGSEGIEALLALITNSAGINFAIKLTLKTVCCGSIRPWSISRTTAKQLFTAI
jgi:hypothetical protein